MFNDRKIHPLAALVLVGLSLIVVSCRPGPRLSHLKGNTMGTFYTVQLVSNAPLVSSLQSEIEACLNEVENELSNWRSDSWISRFNAQPGHQPYPVPDHAFSVIRLSLELANHSNGALDLTSSPLIDLWGFGPERSEIIPDPITIEATLEHIGFRLLTLDSESQHLTKLDANVQLNCSAVAKGYAVDLVAQLLLQQGIDRFIINIGGEIRTHGHSLTNRPWRVATTPVNAPMAHSEPEKVFELTNRSIATSGHTQRVFEKNGHVYSHIIDPRTGYPVEPIHPAATVIADSCALADGLATLALLVSESEMDVILSKFPDAELYFTPWKQN